MDSGRWLLFIHNIPPKPSYFRVKIWRRLQKLGAVAVKNSVYILPKSKASNESFHWIMREVFQAGGEASICEATFVDGLTDQQAESLFNGARNGDYAALADEARKVSKQIPSKGKVSDDRRKEVEAGLIRLKRRLADIVEVDFFGASGRESAEGVINEIDSRLKSGSPETALIGKASVNIKDLKGRTWVTRQGIHVDRIASAWLIRRFIDPKAKFKYVDGKGYQPKAGELRFDMFEAEFTHEGNLCTFEVLIARTHIDDPALRQIAEIIHEIDIGDEQYIRTDVDGIAQLINGICFGHKEDTDRLARGSALFDDLYEYFKRKRK